MAHFSMPCAGQTACTLSVQSAAHLAVCCKLDGLEVDIFMVMQLVNEHS